MSATRPLPTRHDPQPSPEVDFSTRAGNGVIVHNRDPKMTYCLVAQNQMAMQTYAVRGFKQVDRTADGPRIFAEGIDEAEGPVTYMGHVLMCAPKALIDKQDRDGCLEIGAQGTKEFDELERLIVKSVGTDPMRGIAGRNGIQSIKPLNDEAS